MMAPGLALYFFGYESARAASMSLISFKTLGMDGSCRLPAITRVVYAYMTFHDRSWFLLFPAVTVLDALGGRNEAPRMSRRAMHVPSSPISGMKNSLLSDNTR